MDNHCSNASRDIPDKFDLDGTELYDEDDGQTVADLEVLSLEEILMLLETRN